ncbi:bestrophin-like domain [Mangrovihabitans endophyticus]|uniref:DUF4239 domain-containing protein n=1 Tax=Mangrovihabitans endophyticus TaxID=1751298 RepID=A0A8J3FQC3_9ACTN|nr:DUF4239 domain-containing protein [Mangrovihabitans endophyticus]GGK99658.1 hypothetical protein GCM10012284_37580 [Mangrovihabitans endophyticus]
MELWLVRDAPAWLVGVTLVLGLPLLTLGLDGIIHRCMPHRRLGRHNTVTGVIVSVVGVAYAIVIGLCVVSLWDGFKDAEHTVRSEAANLTALVPAGAVYGPEVQDRLAGEIVAYERDVLDDWQARTAVDRGSGVADLSELSRYVSTLTPRNEAQRAFTFEAVETIGQAERLRQQVIAETDDRRMSTVMWIGVLGATVAILGLCLFFGLDDAVLRRILLFLSSAVIGINLFLVVEMNYPYYGSFSVSPAPYEGVVTQLQDKHPS